MVGDPAWDGWHLCKWEYDHRSALQINDFVSAVLSDIGPCVICRPVQASVLAAVQRKLAARTVVLPPGEIVSSDDLWLNLVDAREKFLSGDPYLPQKMVVALLLLAKLERHQMWGGNAKGYMWLDVLCKGRGLDEQFSGALPAVLNELISAEYVIHKTSQGNKKYALNPGKRPEIAGFIETREFNGDLERILFRDRTLVSARDLDVIDDRRSS